LFTAYLVIIFCFVYYFAHLHSLSCCVATQPIATLLLTWKTDVIRPIIALSMM
jgi:hypothetical protein